LKTDTASQRYDSIAVSCHKFFGFPSPAGLFITTLKNFENFHVLFEQVHDPEYVLQVPGTITCSRDSVKPAEFHYFSSASAFARQADHATKMLNNADYLFNEMKSHFAHLNPVRANNRSNTIYFRKPDDKLVNRYILAAMELTRDGQKEAYAHIVVMPHVSKAILDRFLSDLDAENK
jgi:histidine decarboxylase